LGIATADYSKSSSVTHFSGDPSLRRICRREDIHASRRRIFSVTEEQAVEPNVHAKTINSA
jgi:hypothetical protein